MIGQTVSHYKIIEELGGGGLADLAVQIADALGAAHGRALFAAGKYEEAAVAFQRAIDHRFPVEPSPIGPVCGIWLARVRVKLGDTASARRLYQDALAALKDADTDLPLLVEARKEYAALEEKH